MNSTILCCVVARSRVQELSCSRRISEITNTTSTGRVRTDPGKVWNVLEFNVEIFKALKSLENDHGYGKVWKNP